MLTNMATNNHGFAQGGICNSEPSSDKALRALSISITTSTESERVEAVAFLRWLIDSEGKYLAHMPEEEAEFVRLLAEGAGVAALDFQDPQHHGRTALLRALAAKRIGLFQALLDAGADPLLTGENDGDCLYHASGAVTFARAHSSITLSADGTEATQGRDFKTAVSGAVMRSGRHYAEFTTECEDFMIGVIGAGFDVESGEGVYDHEGEHKGCLYYAGDGDRYPGGADWEGGIAHDSAGGASGSADEPTEVAWDRADVPPCYRLHSCALGHKHGFLIFRKRP